jgi:hypothetical protein
MFATQLSPMPVATRHAELIADATAVRLARRVRGAGRSDSPAPAPRVRRSWLRTATQPAHLC